MSGHSLLLASIASLGLACVPGAVAHHLATHYEAGGLSPERLGRLVSYFERSVDTGRLAGAVLLIARDGHVQLLEPIGLADRESGRPMQTDTIFQIASMTKPVTSVGALLLLEDGRLLLDDPVSRHLPELGGLQVALEQPDGSIRTEPARREMTVRDLLRHTSGLTYGFFGSSAVDRLYAERGVGRDDRTLAGTVRKLSELPLRHHPGEHWEYGVSTDVLGRLIEVVSGQPLDAFLREHLFEPLGMRDTGFEVPAGSLDRLATTYVERDGELRPVGPRTPSGEPVTYLSGGGGLYSTAGDYLRFAQMLLDLGRAGDRRILSRKTVELMTSDHLGEIPGLWVYPGHGFGLGVAVRREPGEGDWLGSEGEYLWAGASGVLFWVDPQESLVAIMMIQLRPGGGPFMKSFKTLVNQAIDD